LLRHWLLAMLNTEFYGAFSKGEFLHRGDPVLSSEPPRPETMNAPDPELVSRGSVVGD
jgi:hypothetical protein